MAARGRAARLGVAVAQLCGAAIEVVPDWQIAACRVSLDWFKGKSTGNHGFLPLNMFFSCKFPVNQSNESRKYGILWYEMFFFMMEMVCGIMIFIIENMVFIKYGIL